MSLINGVLAKQYVHNIRTNLEWLTDAAMASNCPLGLIDRLHDAEAALDAVAGFIASGPRP